MISKATKDVIDKFLFTNPVYKNHVFIGSTNVDIAVLEGDIERILQIFSIYELNELSDIEFKTSDKKVHKKFTQISLHDTHSDINLIETNGLPDMQITERYIDVYHQ